MKGSATAARRVADRHRGVGERGRVHQGEGGAIAARGLDAVDQHVLGVGLQALELVAGGLRALREVGVDLREGRAAIDLRLAGAEQVEVGAVQDQQLRHRWGRGRGRAVWPNRPRVSRTEAAVLYRIDDVRRTYADL